MIRWIGSIALIVGLAGCATAPPPDPMVFIRTDGQSAKDNPTLQQQFDIDKAVCTGQAQQANMSAAPVYTNNVIDAAIVSNVRQRQAVDVAVGCMAGRGYVYVPLSEAPARAVALKAANVSGAVGTKPAGSH